MTTTRITVTEGTEPIARFVSADDAMAFAAAVTAGTDRVLYVTDRAGWVSLTYHNGFTASL